MRREYTSPEAQVLQLDRLEDFLSDSYEAPTETPNNGMGNSQGEIRPGSPSL